MTGAELIVNVTQVIADYEKKISDLNAEIVVLKANQIPTGIVNIVINDVDMSKVKFT